LTIGFTLSRKPFQISQTSVRTSPFLYFFVGNPTERHPFGRLFTLLDLISSTSMAWLVYGKHP